jgi:hypothetical protein
LSGEVDQQALYSGVPHLLIACSNLGKAESLPTPLSHNPSENIGIIAEGCLEPLITAADFRLV